MLGYPFRGRSVGAFRRTHTLRRITASVATAALVFSYVGGPIATASANTCSNDYHFDDQHDHSDRWNHTKDDHRRGRRWNKAPVAIVIGSAKAFVGTPTKLDATRSFDHDGDIVLYEWDVDDDGSWDIATTDPVAYTTFSSAGRQEVRLRVTDDDDARSIDKKKFEVRRDTKAPVARLVVPSTATVNELAELDASSSYDCEGEIATFSWDFEDDGTIDLVGPEAVVQHAWTAPGTYTVKVVVRDYAGNSDSEKGRIIIEGGADATPEPPTGVSASDVPDDEGEAVAITWDASSEADVSLYRIYRGTAPDGPFTALGTSATASFTDQSAVDGILYHYVVTAIDDASQESAYSAVATATSTDDLAPATPVGLSAVDRPADEGDALVCSWSPNAEPDLAGYRVTMNDSVTGEETMVDLQVAETSKVFDGLVAGRSYSFTAIAYDDAGNASSSCAAVVRAPVDQLAPAAPVNLIAIDVPGDEGGAVALTWSSNAEPDLAGYTLYRAMVPEGVEPEVALAGALPIAGFGPEATEYTDSSGLDSIEYVYALTASDVSANESDNSEAAAVEPLDNMPPSAPLYVTAEDIIDDQGGTVAVTWAPSLSGDVTGYLLQVTDPLGDVVYSADQGMSNAATVDSLVNGSQYSFEIAAYDAAGNPSGWVLATAIPIDNLAPSTPTGVMAVDVVPDQGGVIVVSWSANTEADLAGYDVTCFNSEGAPVDLHDAGFATGFTFDDLDVGGAYSFQVTARDVNGNVSDPCESVSALAIDEVAPDTLSVTAVDHPDDQGGAIDVAWTASAATDIDGYRVYRDGEQIADIEATSYTDTAAGEDPRAYTVCAYDESGNLSLPNDPPASMEAIDNLAPAQPVALAASDVPGNESGAVMVTFQANTEADLDGYRVTCFTGNQPVSVTEAAAGDTSAVFDGLTEGMEYSFQVLAFDTSDNGSPWSLAVTGSPADDVAPLAPIGVSAADVPDDEGGSVYVSWTPNSETDLVGYRVLRNGTQIAEQTDTYLTDTGLVDGTAYEYAVVAFDDAGNVSLATGSAAAIPADNSAPPLPVPQNVAALDNPRDHGGAILLTWDAIDDPAIVGYRVYRSETDGSGYVAVGENNEPEFVDGGLVDGTMYYYVVKSLDAGGVESDASAMASSISADNSGATTVRIENTDPAVVFTSGWWEVSTGTYGTETSGGSLDYATSGTSAVPNVSSCTLTFTGTQVTWLGVRAFNRGIAAVYIDGALVQNVDCYTPGATADDFVWQAPLYTSTELPYGQHTIKIVYTGTKNPAASGYFAVDVDAFEVVAMPDVDAPEAPTGVQVAPGAAQAGGVLSVSWAPVAEPGIAGYRVYRSTSSSGPYGLAATVGNVTSFSDNGLTNGTTYYYKIAAFDAAGNASVRSTMAMCAPMAAPAAVSATDTPADQGTGLDVTWAASAEPDVVGYKVYRASTSAGVYALISTVGNVTSFEDSTVPRLATRYYKVAAVDSHGHLSTLSTAAVGTAIDNVEPTVPISVSARNTPYLAGSVGLVWAPNTESDLAGYRVYRSDALDGTYAVVGGAGSSAVFADSGLLEGATYYYKVTAVDTAGNESPQSIAAVVVVSADAFDAVRFENTDPAVVFTPGWWLADTWLYGTETSDGSLDYATSGTSAVANVTSCTFTFEGSYVTWIGVKAFNRGIASVYVDGVYKQTVDCYTPGSTNEDFVWQAPMYTSPLLSHGQHTIKIVYTGTKNPAAVGTSAVDVDAFDVSP